MKPLLPWQQNIISLSVLYTILEQGRKIPLLLEGDDVFVAPILDDMNRKGLITPNTARDGQVPIGLPKVIADKQFWVVTKQGEELRGRMVAMYDQLLKFEIFAAVNQALQLTPEQSPDGIAPYDNLLDPRFIPSPASEDLRLAMLSWFAGAAQDQLQGKELDPYQIVFMQRLRKGVYNNKDFWFNLRVGSIFKEIEEVVTSAVKWQQMSGNDDESSAAMNAIYTAGMTEQIKRDGQKCTCGAFLGTYELAASKEGKTLDACPCCNASFIAQAAAPVATGGEMCPNCGGDILSWHRKCRGCGARIKRSLPAGTVREVTTVTEVEETSYYNPWGGSYVSYGYVAPAPLYVGVYYDPWDPLLSIAAFSLCCALL